jgi:hypothetical protein
VLETQGLRVSNILKNILRQRRFCPKRGQVIDDFFVSSDTLGGFPDVPEHHQLFVGHLGAPATRREHAVCLSAADAQKVAGDGHPTDAEGHRSTFVANVRFPPIADTS